jgi:hypothetical protein
MSDTLIANLAEAQPAPAGDDTPGNDRMARGIAAP